MSRTKNVMKTPLILFNSSGHAFQRKIRCTAIVPIKSICVKTSRHRHSGLILFLREYSLKFTKKICSCWDDVITKWAPDLAEHNRLPAGRRQTNKIETRRASQKFSLPGSRFHRFISLGGQSFILDEVRTICRKLSWLLVILSRWKTTS